jgi:protein-S-isoprenylcysteine O-methyltransferase Ste14
MGTHEERMTVPPPALLVAAAGTQRLLTRRRLPTTGSRITAAIIAGGSAVLAACTMVTLRRHDTTISPDHPERTRRLVTDGPFALTRNPAYLALTGLLLAHAVLRRSLLALLPAAVFAAVIDRVQIPREEKALQARFGKRFRRYRRRVPRWVGAPEA